MRSREASGPHSALSASEGGVEESREKREERREKIAASSIHCIFTVSRDHLDEGRKTFKNNFNLRNFSKNAVFKFEVDRRLESLHFKGES